MAEVRNRLTRRFGRVGTRAQQGSEGKRGWSRDLVASAALVAGSYVLLALVANWLIETLTGRVSETLRDAVFALYSLVAFVALAWLFVWLQGGGRREVENSETRRSRVRSAHEEGVRD